MIDQIQDIISTACGYYCIVFLYTMTTSKTIEDGIKKIDKMFTAPESNDNVLKTILEKILKEKLISKDIIYARSRHSSNSR